jgi:DNA (cytosine-5)-methyltransferase 1
VFVLENVGGLAYQGKDEGLQFLLRRIADINARTGSQYAPAFQVLNAAEFGVPQLRERFFLVAARDGKQFQFPKPRFAAPAQGQFLLEESVLPGFRTAWDALGDLEEPSEPSRLAVRGKWADLLPSIPEGGNYLWHTDRGGGLPLFGWRRRFWTFLLKLARDKPSWTIQAQPGPAVGPFHWNNRRLSMRELCRLQTFPDDVRIAGSHASVHKQLGNAVPSLLAEVIGREVRRQLLGDRSVSREPALLPPRREPVPSPVKPTPVPTKYRSLIGNHHAHPGTGKGSRAQTRLNPAA